MAELNNPLTRFDWEKKLKILIHSRNGALAEDFREIAESKLKSLARFSIEIDEIKVEIKHEANPHFGKSSHEVILTTHGAGPFIRSEGAGFNDVAAFDSAVEALELQLRKAHERIKDVSHDSVKNKALLK